MQRGCHVCFVLSVAAVAKKSASSIRRGEIKDCMAIGDAGSLVVSNNEQR